MGQLVAETQKARPIDIIESVSRIDFDRPESKGEHFSRKNIDREAERNWTACISTFLWNTGLPKPINIPHRRLMMQLPPAPRQLEFNTFPMFHGYGNWIVIHNIMDRKSTYMYNPNLPVTADYVIKVVEHVKPGNFACSPIYNGAAGIERKRCERYEELQEGRFFWDRLP